MSFLRYLRVDTVHSAGLFGRLKTFVIDSTSSGPGMFGDNPKLGFHVLIFHFGILCVPDKCVLISGFLCIFFLSPCFFFSLLLLITSVIK